MSTTRSGSLNSVGSYARVIGVILLMAFASLSLSADVIEEQNNPVANGTISVAPGDSDRSDWDGIPWFEADEEDELEPVDIHRIQIAHDTTNVYFHLQTHLWDAPEAWRVGVYLDLDQDSETGFNGFNSSPLGIELLSEGPTLWEFAGADPTVWGWEPLIETLTLDQSASMLDVEWLIPLEELDYPPAFDFRLVANNDCCDFGLPLDYYPEESNIRDGGYFTYELGAVALVGDFDGNGTLDATDLDIHAQMIRRGNLSGDLNDDGETNAADRLVWIESVQGSWAGDANFDGEFNSSDLVGTFTTGKYETGLAATYVEGDWNGDLVFGSGDLVFAFAHGGYELGPRASVATVPEPGARLMLLLGLLFIRVLRVGTHRVGFEG